MTTRFPRFSTPTPSDKPISSKSFGGGESLISTKNANVKLPAWAQKITEGLPVPATTLNPFVTNLPNGIKLIVQPESVSDTVSIYGRVKNNPKVQMPEGKDGVDEALDKLFSYGTKSLDRLAFQKALDDIGANESAGADFSLQVLPEHFDARHRNCSRTMSFRPRCPQTISKSFNRNWPRASPANCKAPTTSPATR